MNINKNGGGVNRVKAVVMAGVVATNTTLTSIPVVNLYLEQKREEELKSALIKMREVEKNILDKKEKERKLEEYLEGIRKRSKELEEIRKEQERMKDYTYRTIKKLKEQTGLNVVGFKEYVFELSFYSDLNCENGYGNLTANGERLSSGMIANNFLPFNTKVYIEGYGTKRVTDRGSKKYFNAINKADVFVPRNSGESDSSYYRRVNNMGRKNVKGYILEIGD